MEASYKENYGKQLHKLLNSVQKSQKRYHEASEKISSAEIKELFDRFAHQRDEIMGELREAINHWDPSSNDDLIVDPGVSNWNSSNPENSKSDQSVLESIRGTEQEVLDKYDDVLQGSILEEFDLKTMLMSHRLTINEAFAELDKKYFALFKLSQPY